MIQDNHRKNKQEMKPITAAPDLQKQYPATYAGQGCTDERLDELGELEAMHHAILQNLYRGQRKQADRWMMKYNTLFRQIVNDGKSNQ